MECSPGESAIDIGVSPESLQYHRKHLTPVVSREMGHWLMRLQADEGQNICHPSPTWAGSQALARGHLLLPSMSFKSGVIMGGHDAATIIMGMGIIAIMGLTQQLVVSYHRKLTPEELCLVGASYPWIGSSELGSRDLAYWATVSHRVARPLCSTERRHEVLSRPSPDTPYC